MRKLQIKSNYLYIHTNKILINIHVKIYLNRLTRLKIIFILKFILKLIIFKNAVKSGRYVI